MSEQRRSRAASADAAQHYRAMSTGSKGKDGLPMASKDSTGDDDTAVDTGKAKMLVISFIAMIFVGLGNKIFQKLETIPMYNYPNFLNLLTTGM